MNRLIHTLFLLVSLFPALPLQAADSDGYARDRRHEYFFLEAVNQQNAGNYAAAYDLLTHCLSIRQDAPEVYYHIAMYYSAMKKDSLALACLEKAASLAPENDTYLERTAQFYIASGQTDKAIQEYERLAANHGDRIDALNILASLYQKQGNYDKMISVLDKMEIIEGPDEDITLAKMRVYEMKGDSKMAYKTLSRLVREEPDELKYQTMLGNWLMQKGKNKEAYKQFAKVLKEDPDNAYALSSLYDYYTAEKNTEEADRLLERMLLNKNTETSTKAQLLRQFIEENDARGGDSTAVLALFDRVLAQPQANSDLAVLKGAYMYGKQMPDSCIVQAFQDALDIEPDNKSVRLQLIQLVWPTGDYDKVISLSQPGIEYNPDEMAFYYFQGMAWFQKKDNDRALMSFRRGVSQINKDSNVDIVSDFYAIMGDILHMKGMTGEAFAAYDSCLQWKDDNIGCLNNYAYYLSEEDTDLPKAEKMSYRTIKAEPANATYLDTYSWILFKEGRYEEARKYIDLTLENTVDSVNNSVIIDHAGDIYFMNGDAGKAVEYWQKALETAEDADKALIERKIKNKKYIRKDEK